MLVRCLYYCGFLAPIWLVQLWIEALTEPLIWIAWPLFELGRRTQSQRHTQEVLPVEPREAGRLFKDVFFIRFGLHRYALLLACRFQPVGTVLT